MLRPRVTILAALGIMMCSSPAFAKHIYVTYLAKGADNGRSWGDAYLKLSDAILAAKSGDIIHYELSIEETTYTIAGKNLTIIGENSGLSGYPEHHIFGKSFPSGPLITVIAPARVTLENLIFSGNLISIDGGSADLTVRGCKFRDNEVAVKIENGSIEQNDFRDNARSVDLRGGRVSITDNYFGNFAALTSRIHVQGSAARATSLTVFRNRFNGAEIDHVPQTTGIVLRHPHDDTMIAYNELGHLDVALDLQAGVHRVYNNDISSSDVGVRLGGTDSIIAHNTIAFSLIGIYCPPSAAVDNSLVANNALYRNEQYAYAASSERCEVMLQTNAATLSGFDDYSGPYIDGGGNLSGVAFEWRRPTDWTSPLVDAGTALRVSWMTDDFDLQPRDGAPDIGAYELQRKPFIKRPRR